MIFSNNLANQPNRWPTKSNVVGRSKLAKTKRFLTSVQLSNQLLLKDILNSFKNKNHYFTAKSPYIKSFMVFLVGPVGQRSFKRKRRKDNLFLPTTFRRARKPKKQSFSTEMP